MIEITPWAADVLRRADEAARRLNPDARIRLVARGSMLEATLVDAEEPGDTSIDAGGVLVLAAEGVKGLVDVEAPHDRLVLKPSGSPQNQRPD